MDFNVDLFNMKSVIDAFEKYGRDLDEALHDGMLDFANQFEAKLLENASALGVPLEVIEMPIVDIDGYELTITVGGDEVFYYEYGTGIVGSQNPHPDDPWEYDVNGHGEDGWYYIPSENHHLSYADNTFVNKRGDTVAHTKGIPSKPFIYKTCLWGKRSIVNVIRKHIRRLG